MEAIEVTARFAADGTVQPTEFIWQDRTYRVEAVGRSWESQNKRHILVMTSGERVFELVFVCPEGEWYLIIPGKNRVAI